MEKLPTVLITGCAGYVGSVITLTFLKEGSFRVRGSVRNKATNKHLASLLDVCKDFQASLDIVEMDLMDVKTIDQAVKGVDFVINCGFPASYNLTNEEYEPITKQILVG